MELGKLISSNVVNGLLLLSSFLILRNLIIFEVVSSKFPLI
ncbi:unnamed protein product, partial [marine sediment metagenome]